MTEDRTEPQGQVPQATERPTVPNLKRRITLLALGPLTLGLFHVGGFFPWTMEALYGSGLGPWTVRGLTVFSGLTRLPLVELVVLSVLGWVGWACFREWRAHRGSGLWRIGLAWLLVVGQTASVLLASFYVLWGFNYDRPPLEARLGWEEIRQIEADELALLAEEAVGATNEAYRALHGVDDLGEPTRMPEDPGEIEHALVEGWSSAAAELRLSPTLGRSFGPVKTLMADGVLSELGLLGFYFPYTGEPVVNGRAPAVILPRSMAHEQAHQRGIAAEDEANFMSLMATVHSPHPLARYAGVAMAQRRLLNELWGVDRDRALELMRMRIPGVLRDARALDEFYESLQGPVNDVAERVNDAYLRHHRVEGGIRSYGLVLRLMVAYSRQRGGTLLSP